MNWLPRKGKWRGGVRKIGYGENTERGWTWKLEMGRQDMTQVYKAIVNRKAASIGTVVKRLYMQRLTCYCRCSLFHRRRNPESVGHLESIMGLQTLPDLSRYCTLSVSRPGHLYLWGPLIDVGWLLVLFRSCYCCLLLFSFSSLASFPDDE